MKPHLLLLLSLLPITTTAQTSDTAKQQSLWTKLESTITDVDHNLDGVLGVAIEDLTTNQKFLLRADSYFAQIPSSRKPAP